MARRWGIRDLRKDDGVSAVIVVISLTAILGGAMLSVDAGSLWQQRRKLITDTDAAALAAARYVDAAGPQACRAAVGSGINGAAADEARSIMLENGQASTLEEFSVHPYKGDCDQEAGQVRVGGRIPATLTFAPVFGIDEVKPYSVSTAQYGPIIAMKGVRPVGICDKSEHFREWKDYVLNNGPLPGGSGEHPSYESGYIVHRVYFQRGPSGCGTGSGNWDWLDFNETSNPNGNSALRAWLYDGYQNEVSVGGDDYPRDCNPEETGEQPGCPPKTGAGGGSFEDALQWLRDNRKVVPIMVYDRVVDKRNPNGCNAPQSEWTGSGENTRFCAVAFLLVRFWGWSRITGQLGPDSYIDLEFVDVWWQGRIGGKQPNGVPQTHGIQLCGGNYGTTVDNNCDV